MVFISLMIATSHSVSCCVSNYNFVAHLQRFASHIKLLSWISIAALARNLVLSYVNKRVCKYNPIIWICIDDNATHIQWEAPRN